MWTKNQMNIFFTSVFSKDSDVGCGGTGRADAVFRVLEWRLLQLKWRQNLVCNAHKLGNELLPDITASVASVFNKLDVVQCAWRIDHFLRGGK